MWRKTDKQNQNYYQNVWKQSRGRIGMNCARNKIKNKKGQWGVC